jgi:hypothetical protein
VHGDLHEVVTVGIGDRTGDSGVPDAVWSAPSGKWFVGQGSVPAFED